MLDNEDIAEGSTIAGEIDSDYQNNEEPQEDSAPQETQTELSATDKNEPEQVSVNWEEAPPQYRDSYKQFQREFTRKSQELAEREKTLNNLQAKISEFEPKVKYYDQLDNWLKSDQRVFAKFQELLSNGNESKVLDDLDKDDPFYQPLQDAMTRISQLEAKLASHDKTFETQSLNQRVDKEISNARAAYKQMFGENPTDNEIGQVLQEMQNLDFYNGEKVTKALFADKYADHKISQLTQSREKKRGLVGRGSSLNSSKARDMREGSGTLRDAFEKAKQELGITF